MNRWLCCVDFPVLDGGFVYPDELADLALEQAEVEPVRAEMGTDGGQLLGIRDR